MSETVPKFARAFRMFVVAIVLYVLSSGPVLALAFWLREATGWDSFYLTIVAYYPIHFFGPDSWGRAYVGWWVELLGTVGPG